MNLCLHWSVSAHPPILHHPYIHSEVLCEAVVSVACVRACFRFHNDRDDSWFPQGNHTLERLRCGKNHLRNDCNVCHVCSYFLTIFMMTIYLCISHYICVHVCLHLCMCLFVCAHACIFRSQVFRSLSWIRLEISVEQELDGGWGLSRPTGVLEVPAFLGHFYWEMLKDKRAAQRNRKQNSSENPFLELSCLCQKHLSSRAGPGPESPHWCWSLWFWAGVPGSAACACFFSRFCRFSSVLTSPHLFCVGGWLPV